MKNISKQFVAMNQKPVSTELNFTDSNSTNISLPRSANTLSLFVSDDLSMGIALLLFLLTSIVGAAGNLFLLVTLLKQKKLKLSEYLILNLILSDFSTCVISIPLDITERILLRFPFGSILCKIVYPLQTVLMAVSVLTLLLMSYERYRLIVTPFKGAIRGRYLGLLIFFTWVGAVIFVLPYVLVLRLDGSECMEYWPDPIASPKIYTLCSFVFLYAIPLVIISLYYALVARTLRNDIRFIVEMKFQSRSAIDEASLLKIKCNLRTVKTFVTAVLVFSVCLLPTHVTWIWKMFGNGSSHPHNTEITTFCNIVMYANSAINPFIFGSIHLSRAFHYCRSRVFCTPCNRKKTATENSHSFPIIKSTYEYMIVETKLSVL